MLEQGTRVGHYEILEPIGQGGMGEVYRARDTKLGRDVAIKVLPEEFSRNERRLARFEREAKVLASLNHPNIASIYGVEETKPFWSSDGRTLYFASGDRLMAASISTTPDLAATRPVEVLSLGQDVHGPHGIGVIEVFGQDRDGRFLAIAFPPVTSVTQLEAIFNWQP